MANKLLLLLPLMLARAAHADCLDATAAFANVPFAAFSSPFTAQFSAASFAPNIDGVIGFAQSPASGYSNLAGAVRFNNQGYIDVRNGSAYTAQSPIPYSQGAWFLFRMIVDPVNKRYSAYVTPSGGTERPVGTWLPFRPEAAVSSIGAFVSQAASGAHQVCGLAINGVAVALKGGLPAPTPSPTPTPTPTPTPAPGSVGVDRFGVKKLYASASGGKDWVSKWDNGVSRTFKWGADPSDPWFKGRGDATYAVDGRGEFRVSGPVPRMYVWDPAFVSSWRNVEMTVYAKRVSDSSTSWGGIVGLARTNHGANGVSETVAGCDSRGIGARFRYDGKIDFEKETKHPASVVVNSKAKWPALPYNTWIGYKYVVYDLSNGNVKVESWLDLTDGLGGGAWQKVNEFEDNGSNWGGGGTPCKAGVSPALRLTNSDARQGSESGKPNIAVYFRSDNVGTNGLIYKRMSVREIQP